jgi:tetratricopeptide (TPR) repeat protein
MARSLSTDLVERQKRKEKALEMARETVAANPDSAPARVDLSSYLREAAQFDEALLHARRAAELAPDYFEARWQMALLLQQQKRYADAAQACREALRIRPGDSDTKALLESSLESVLKL